MHLGPEAFADSVYPVGSLMKPWHRSGERTGLYLTPPRGREQGA